MITKEEQLRLYELLADSFDEIYDEQEMIICLNGILSLLVNLAYTANTPLEKMKELLEVVLKDYSILLEQLGQKKDPPKPISSEA